MAKTRFKDYPQVPELIPASVELVRDSHDNTKILGAVIVRGQERIELSRADVLAVRYAAEHSESGRYLREIRGYSTIGEASPTGATHATSFIDMEARLITNGGSGWTTARGTVERQPDSPLTAPTARLERRNGDTLRLDEGMIRALRTACETRRMHTGTLDRLSGIPNDSQLARIETRTAQFRQLAASLPSYYLALSEAQDRRIEAAEAKLARITETVQEAKARKAEEERRQAEEAARRAEEEQARRDEEQARRERERAELEAKTPSFKGFDAEFAAKRGEIDRLEALIRKAEAELEQ